MSANLFSKFSLYDQIGYVAVGAVALVLVQVDFWAWNIASPRIDFGLGEAFILLVVAYFLGHLFQTLSNLFIREKEVPFSETEKGLLKTVRDSYSLPDLTDQQAYGVAIVIATQADTSGQVQSFGASYGLYRGWSTVFACQSLVTLVLAAVHWFDLVLTLTLLTSAAITFLMMQRAGRFFRYSRTKTLYVAYLTARRLFSSTS